MNQPTPTPTPIIDNLEQIGNPFKLHTFDASPFLIKALDGADVDLEYALKFLFSYNGSQATFNSYRREIERLLQWCWHVELRSLLTLKREDIQAYIEFCSRPPLSWIGVKQVSRFKLVKGQRLPNPDWRPFNVSVSKSQFNQGLRPDKKSFHLSQAAIKSIFSILSSFYNFLLQENLIDANPVTLIRQKSKFIQKRQRKTQIRRISSLQWDYVIETAELMALENPSEHERTLFIMNALFAMYLRISELVADERSLPLMSDFQKDQDGNWWFHVLGKGNKNRSITVCPDMLEALKRYRRYLGLSALPHADENTPLIPKSRGMGAISSTRQIRRIVQNCFDRAYERMQQDGLEEDAADLKAATVHWLRHTGISEDVKFRPREHVRDDAGHASMATTDRYIDSDRRERHASAARKRIRDIS